MWIDEYIKLQFPFNPDKMRIEEAAQLKHKHIPKTLYRYRNFKEWNLENLMNQQERLSYPSEFNDPFDAGIKIDYNLLGRELFLQRNMERMVEPLKKVGVSFSEQEENIIRNSSNPFYSFAKHVAQFDEALQGNEETFAKAISEITFKQIKESFDQFKVVFQTGYLVMCVSEVKDSILMWSHYAENHSGFCIEYNYQELGPYNPQSRTIFPVIYKDGLFDATRYLLQPLLSNEQSYNNLFGIYPAISKSTVWEYEKEWRIVFPLGPNALEKDRFITVPKPKALYVGAKASSENIEKLKEIALKKEIPVYQIEISEYSHELNKIILYHPSHS